MAELETDNVGVVIFGSDGTLKEGERRSSVELHFVDVPIGDEAAGARC